MKVYQLDILNYFVNETECFQDKFGDYLIPGGCVKNIPPEIKQNEIQFWNGTSWEIKPDYSGKLYYSKINKLEKYFQRGEKFDDNYTDLVPPAESYIVWIIDKWAIDKNKEKQFNLDACKDESKKLIAQSDWSVLPDVKIQNKVQFENYRSTLRNLILNPIEDPIFPIEPAPVWIIQPDITGDNNG
jgi:hypothetical protein